MLVESARKLTTYSLRMVTLKGDKKGPTAPENLGTLAIIFSMERQGADGERRVNLSEA